MQIFLRRAGQTLLVAGAIICFLITLWLAINDKASSATVTAAMALGLLILLFVPVLESVEAFGLKAKLRGQISEPQKILDQLRRLAVVSSRTSYLQLAWMNRIGTPRLSTKDDLVRSLTDTLIETGIEEADAKKMAEPFLRIIAFDIFSIFNHVLDSRRMKYAKEIQEEIGKKFPNSVNQADPEWIRLQGIRKSWYPDRIHFQSIEDDNRLLDLESLFNKMLDQLPLLPSDDRERIQRFGKNLAAISSECFSEGAVSKKALHLLEREDDSWKNDYQDLFSEPPR